MKNKLKKTIMEKNWIEKIKECTYEGINIEFSDRVRPKNIDEFFTVTKAAVEKIQEVYV